MRTRRSQIMSRRAIGVLFAVFAVMWGSCTLAKPAQLTIGLQIRDDGAGPELFAQVSNVGDEAICIKDDILLGRSQNLTLFYKNGSRVELKRFLEFGVGNWTSNSDSFVFIRPGETLDLLVGLDDYKAVESPTRYEAIFVYYSCNSIIHESYDRLRRDGARVFSGSGNILLIP